MRNVSWIFHILLGGGDRHKLAICALAIVAANSGYKVERMDLYKVGQYGEVPDLIISKKHKVRQPDVRGLFWKTYRYRCEIVDTHDPLLNYKSLLAGFDDVVKVELKRGDDYCAGPCGTAPHLLCVKGLLKICEAALP